MLALATAWRQQAGVAWLVGDDSGRRSAKGETVTNEEVREAGEIDGASTHSRGISKNCEAPRATGARDECAHQLLRDFSQRRES